VDKHEILQYLTREVDLLQRKAVELQEQHGEIEKELMTTMANIATYPFI